MLIQCTNCQSKIRVPDSSAGKKGKCPKCGTVLVIPATEDAPREGALPPSSSATPISDSDVPEVDVREAPAADEPQTAYASTLPPPIPSAPPPVRRASRRDEAEPPRRDQRDDDRPSRDRDDDEPRRSRNDEDDEYDEPRRGRDDDLNIRRTGRRQQSIGMSLTAMILGISGLVLSIGSVGGGLLLSTACCCGPFTTYIGFGVSGILGVLGVVFGFIGLKHSGKGLAWTGIITGGLNLVLIVLYIILTLVLGLALFGLGAAIIANQPPQQNFGPQFRPPPPNFGPPPFPRKR